MSFYQEWERQAVTVSRLHRLVCRLRDTDRFLGTEYKQAKIKSVIQVCQRLMADGFVKAQ